MLPVSADAVRLFLHVLAATIWVGGQLTLAALVPVLRGTEGVAAAAARQYARVAWPAFAVLLIPGFWNITALDHPTPATRTTLYVKLGVVVLSGVAAYVHAEVSTPRARAVWGALTGLTALAALLLGIMISEAPSS